MGVVGSIFWVLTQVDSAGSICKACQLQSSKLDCFTISFKLGTPKDIKYNNVKVSLESIEGVVAAHSLHIWSLTVNKAALSVHLAIGWYSEL